MPTLTEKRCTYTVIVAGTGIQIVKAESTAHAAAQVRKNLGSKVRILGVRAN